jgi:hypothetical protein
VPRTDEADLAVIDSVFSERSRPWEGRFHSQGHMLQNGIKRQAAAGMCPTTATVAASDRCESASPKGATCDLTCVCRPKAVAVVDARCRVPFSGVLGGLGCKNPERLVGAEGSEKLS